MVQLLLHCHSPSSSGANYSWRQRRGEWGVHQRRVCFKFFSLICYLISLPPGYQRCWLNLILVMLSKKVRANIDCLTPNCSVFSIVGLLKCKLVSKQGSRVSVSDNVGGAGPCDYHGITIQFKMKTKYCVQLTRQSLFLMPSKYKKSVSKRSTVKTWDVSFFFQKKSTKLKCIKLRGCHVKHKDPATRLKDKKFIIIDDKGEHSSLGSV